MKVPSAAGEDAACVCGNVPTKYGYNTTEQRWQPGICRLGR